MTERQKRPYSEIVAGDLYRSMLVPRADIKADANHGAPLWHGWAIMDAFLAGIDYARRIDGEQLDGGKDG